MKSYSERKIFDGWCQQAFELATYLVDMLPKHELDGREIRCHELARAVGSVIGWMGFKNTVQDGKLWSIEHSWLVIGEPYGKILDVYVPGRLPQVQLLDTHYAVMRGYEPDRDSRYASTRTDIRGEDIEEIIGMLKEPISKWRT